VVCLGLSGGESVKARLCLGDKANSASASLVPGPGLVIGGSKAAGTLTAPVVESTDPKSARNENLVPGSSSVRTMLSGFD